MPDWLTATLAVVGSSLGILNAWHSFFYKNRVRLKVASFPSIDGGFFVIVTNLGFLTATVESLLFSYSHGRKKGLVGHPPFPPLPVKLEPRTSVRFQFSRDLIEEIPLDHWQRPIVRTECGKEFKGNRLEFQQAAYTVIHSNLGSDFGCSDQKIIRAPDQQ